MKYMKKYIALGIGIGLVFTATRYIEAIFTSEFTQSNNISLDIKEKNDVAVDFAKKAYFTHTNNSKFSNLFIPIKVSGGINSENITIETKVDGKLYSSLPYTHVLDDIKTSIPNYIQIIWDGKNDMPVNTNYEIELKISKSGEDPISYKMVYYITRQSNQGNNCGDATHPDHGHCQIAKLEKIELDKQPINDEAIEDGYEIPEDDTTNQKEDNSIDQGNNETPEDIDDEIIEEEIEDIGENQLTEVIGN